MKKLMNLVKNTLTHVIPTIFYDLLPNRVPA